MEKQLVFKLFEEFRRDWLSQARHKALEIALRRGEVCADDIHEECPVPGGIDPRVMGAVFASKDWLKVGYTQSKRKVCHNRPIAIFQLV